MKFSIPAAALADAAAYVTKAISVRPVTPILPGDTVRIGFTTAAKPALLTSPESSGATRHLLMPVRLPG